VLVNGGAMHPKDQIKPLSLFHAVGDDTNRSQGLSAVITLALRYFENRIGFVPLIQGVNLN
jgi:hypothetical protein